MDEKFEYEEEFAECLDHFDIFVPEGYDGESLRKSNNRCADFYIDLFKENYPEASQIVAECKNLTDVSFDTPDLYFAEKKFLNSYVPRLAAFADEKRKELSKIQETISSTAADKNRPGDSKAIHAKDMQYISRYELVVAALEVADFLLVKYVNNGIDGVDYSLWPDYNPVFTHPPVYTDITEAFAGDPVFLALSNVSRLYSSRIYNNIFYFDGTVCTVRMWDSDGMSFNPLSININKEEILKDQLSSNKNRALWPMLFAKAVEQSGQSTLSIGKITESLFGEDFRYLDLSGLASSSYDDEDAFDDLCQSIDSWINSGYPISIKLARGCAAGSGYYNVWSIYTPDDGSNTKYLRLYNIKETVDAAIKDILPFVTAFDVNMTGALRGSLQTVHVGRDLVDLEQIDEYKWHIISDAMYDSYLKVTAGLYMAFMNTISLAEEPEKHTRQIFDSMAMFVSFLSASVGLNERVIEKYLEPLAQAAEIYIKNAQDNMKVHPERVRVCKSLVFLNEIYHRNDESRFDPLSVIKLEFAKKYAKQWLKKHEIDTEDYVVEYKAYELCDDPKFAAILDRIPAVNLLYPTPKQMESIYTKYES